MKAWIHLEDSGDMDETRFDRVRMVECGDNLDAMKQRKKDQWQANVV